MKDFKIILLLALLVGCISVHGQQGPVFTNYIFEQTLYNPAHTGLQKDVEMTMNFKKHYNKIAGGPVTGYFGFDMPLMRENIGIGASFVVDRVGPKSNLSGNFAYAYHIPFKSAYEHKLSIGLTAGFFHQGFNFDELVPNETLDNTLNALNSGGATAFDMAIGMNYRFKGLDVGFSVPQILDSKLVFDRGGNTAENSGISHLRRHYFVSVGYEAALGKEKKHFLTPSAAMRKVKGIPVQFDGNIIYNYDRLVWFGVSFKTANGFAKAASISPIVGFNIKDRMDINYAFQTDLDETENQDFGQGHEVMLKVKFGKRFKEIEDRLDNVEDAVLKNAEAIAQNGERIDSLDDKLDSLADQVNTNTQNIAENAENITNIFNTVEELMASKDVMYKKVGSVFFKVDSHELDATAKAKLDAFKEALSEPVGEYFIYVAGNASEEAPNDYNMLLSARRSAAVKQYLESIGIKGHIFILYYGEESPMVTPQNNEENRAQNRRVDIFISGNTNK
jgi:type IX secretion system PorP/SprF family membrane protein